MPKVFISYRREDSQDIAGRIYDRLAAHYGAKNVVYDVDAVPLGVDFRTYLDDQVRLCEVLLAIIGRDWLTVVDQNDKRRLDSPRDYLRIEIESAKAHGIPVIPVLVRRASVPDDTDLPASLAFLPYINAATVSSGKDFDPHIQRLIRGIDGLIEFLAQSERRSSAEVRAADRSSSPSVSTRMMEPSAVPEPDAGERLLEELKREALKLLPSANWKSRHDWWFLGSDRGSHVLKAKPSRNTLRVRVRKNPSRRTGVGANAEGWVFEKDSKPVVLREQRELLQTLKLFKREWF